MQKNILPGLRITFWVHLIVGAIFGLGYLLVPDAIAGIAGIQVQDSAMWRLIGAAICAFAASSWWAIHETEWAHVKIIVEAEIVWTVLATLVEVYGNIGMGYPIMAWLGAVIMAAFAVAFGYFYMRQQSVATTVPAPR